MRKNQSNWISLSDMMTGLMLVFLFLSILAIHEVQKREQLTKDIVTEFAVNRADLYEELDAAFQDKYQKWNMVLTRDLSIKFENPDVLFGYLQANITSHFQSILDEFIPTYLSILNQEKYKETIKEVRIEGHTASWPDYLFTVKLSQNRANAVLSYILNSDFFQQFKEPEKTKFKFWLTSNGLGLGRTLDETGHFTFFSEKPVSVVSRRVEFRIVTTSEELVDEIITNYNLNK